MLYINFFLKRVSMKFFNYLFFFFCSVNLFPSLFTVQASTLEVTDAKEMAGGLYSISRRLSIYEGDPHYNKNKGISGIYGSTLVYPKAPLMHPYHPQNGERINDGVANVPLQVHFPTSIRNALPDSIRRELELNHVTNDCLKILAVGQNFPWERGTIVCFRPQYATEPSGTELGYNKTRQLRLGLFNSEENRVFFTGHQPNELINIGLSAHPTSNADQRTILSGSQPEIQGLAPDRGTSFWSYVGYRDDQDLNKYKAIVTLHWLLSDRQETALSEIIRGLPAKPSEADLENLIPILGTNPDFLNEGEHIQKLLPVWNALERVEKEARKKKLQLVEQREKVAAAQKAKAVAAQKAKAAAAHQRRVQQIAAQRKKAEAARQRRAQQIAAQRQKAEAARQRRAQQIAAQRQKAEAARQRRAQQIAAQKAKAAAAQKAAAQRKKTG